MKIDNRLVGQTSENIFFSLLNQKGVFAHPFDTAGFDGIVFDFQNELFKVGKSPFFIQIKCRGAKGHEYNAQGHSQKTIEKIRNVARELQLPDTSLYFVVGFFKNDDIRKILYYVIPFGSLGQFEKNGNYRFSPVKCKEESVRDMNITIIE